MNNQRKQQRKKNNNSKEISERSKTSHKNRSNQQKSKKQKISAERSQFLETAHITQRRLTLKQGLYTAGKGSSSVFRDYYQSEERKAREEEDLGKILKLADASRPREGGGNRSLEAGARAPLDAAALKESAHCASTAAGGDSTAAHTTFSGDDDGDDDCGAGDSIALQPHRPRSSRAASPLPSAIRSISDRGKRRCSSEEDLTTPEELVMENVAQDLRNVFKEALNMIFPDKEDYFTKSCQYLQNLGTESLRENLHKNYDDALHTSSSKYLSEINRVSRSRNCSPPGGEATEVEPNNINNNPHPFRHFLSDVTHEPQDIFVFSEMAAPKATLSERPIVGSDGSWGPAGKPFSHPGILPIRDRSQPDDNAVCQCCHRPAGNPEYKVALFPLLPVQVDQLPENYEQMPVEPFSGHVHQGALSSHKRLIRHQMLLRLQDPDDKDILDYVDNVVLDTPPPPSATIGLTAASPDSDGAQTWQLPVGKKKTSVTLPNEPLMASAATTRRFFRHKLY